MTITHQRPSSLAGAIIVSVTILLSYAMISFFQPFSALINTLLLGLLTIISAASTALMSTLVFRCYEPDDLPRTVWLNFAIGFWIWVLAEINFATYEFDLPTLGLARLLWLSAFGFFSYALFVQHKIISSGPAKSPIIILYYWLAAIAVSILIVISMGMPVNFENVAEYFSALANLTVGIIAIKLAFTFRGGALARPWWGFVGLALSDIIYAISVFIGADQIKGLILATEMVYIAAYLSMAFGFFGQYLLLKFGVMFLEDRGLQNG